MLLDVTSSNYIVCASPRSGSTLLCDLLSQTGVAGKPRSFFRPASISEFSYQWGLEDGLWGKEYVEAAKKAGASANRVFGIRIMWSDFTGFVSRLDQLYPCSGNAIDLLNQALGVTHYLHVYREDKVAQAVSLAIAKQTGLWHRNADGNVRQQTGHPKQASYNRQLIASELAMLETEAEGWKSWFEHNQMTPLTIKYEDLAQDPSDTLQQALDHIGLEMQANVKPETQKLANQINQEWAHRFRGDTGTTPVSSSPSP